MKQAFIFAVEVIQQLFQIRNVHFDCRRKNIRIVACFGSFFLFVNFHRLHSSQLCLDKFKCRDLIQRCNVQIDTEKVL